MTQFSTTWRHARLLVVPPLEFGIRPQNVLDKLEYAYLSKVGLVDREGGGGGKKGGGNSELHFDYSMYSDVRKWEISTFSEDRRLGISTMLSCVSFSINLTTLRQGRSWYKSYDWDTYQNGTSPSAKKMNDGRRDRPSTILHTWHGSLTSVHTKKEQK